jgi:hypothetical protein
MLAKRQSPIEKPTNNLLAIISQNHIRQEDNNTRLSRREENSFEWMKQKTDPSSHKASWN